MSTETTATPTSTADPIADLRSAADLIRSQHKADDRLFWFWAEVANMFGANAERCEAGRVVTLGDWSDWNGSVRAARTYLDQNGTEGES